VSTPSSETSIWSNWRANAEPIADIDQVNISPLLDRIADACVVLLGEATHGTSEFYRMRARITKELILRRGFNFIAIEADWPDAARINQYIRHAPAKQEQWKAFARFPDEPRDLVRFARRGTGANLS
jgi:erythromycin esterase-like protein